jgi:hypothetical protein
MRAPLWSSGQSSWLHNGDVLCFLWATNWIYICYVEESRPPLWSSGQSSWLKNIDVLWFLWGTNWIYICYVEESRPPLWSSAQSFWLLRSRNREYSRGVPSCWPLDAIYPQKLALTWPSRSCRSVGIVCSRTKATVLLLLLLLLQLWTRTLWDMGKNDVAMEQRNMKLYCSELYHNFPCHNRLFRCIFWQHIYVFIIYPTVPGVREICFATGTSFYFRSYPLMDPLQRYSWCLVVGFLLSFKPERM